ncbi:MAG: hypothetical protein L0Z62_11115 [Gemmataceae bacterium]|nr:hypothetical protein [Gemmataceae bacterium]
MMDSRNPPEQPHKDKDYEDPHFHDDGLDVDQDDTRQRPRPPSKGKPPRRIPPPPRRRHED